MRVDATATLSIKARVSFDDFSLDLDQDIELDGITGLFGPSGGGKSTLLRVIAGLEKNATGRVAFGDQIWQDKASSLFVSAHKRPIGFVFQDVRLFEHLDVQGNLRYADSRSEKHDTAIDYSEVAEAFDLGNLLNRSVTVLSGGERQRVAIARTLLTQPRLLLLDEPLAALDAGKKEEILPYIEALPRRFGIPAIYVSHAAAEIARLTNRVVALDKGEIKAVGTAADILSRVDLQSPASRFEAITIMETRVIEHLRDSHLTRLDHCGQALVVPILEQTKPGDIARLHIRAGDVALATRKPEAISFRNILEGTLSAIDNHPDTAFATVSINVGDTVLRAHLTQHAISDLHLEIGAPVFALLKTASFDERASLS